VIKLPRHPDFEKIYRAFMQRYCKGDSECDTGKQYYYRWLNKLGLDDTKPYQKPQEKFSWTEPYIQFLKEDEDAKYFKVEALFPLSSMNNNLYTQDELSKACRTLIGKTVNLNHKGEVFTDINIVDADYEDDCVECLLRVKKQSRVLELIEKGEIINVSVEADCLRGAEPTPEGNLCRGLVFTGLALLTKDMLPGVPLTRILPVERLVESFTVTILNENKEETINKEEKATVQEQNVEKKAEETVKSEAEWDTAYINDLPDNCFAYIEPGGKKDDQGKTVPRALRHLPYKNAQGSIDLPHLRNAFARLNQTSLSSDAKKQALNVLCKAAKQVNIDSPLCGEAEQAEKQEAKEPEKQEQKTPCEQAKDTLLLRLETLEKQVAELSKPKTPETKTADEAASKTWPNDFSEQNFWRRFHQLRSEGLSKSDAFRIVSTELIAALAKKKQ
jgi:hypothetical protein